MRNPLRKMAVLLALLIAGTGSGALAMPADPRLGEAGRLVGAALDVAGAALHAVMAVASAGLAHVGGLLQSHGLAGLAASPTMLVGFLVGSGASLLALIMVLAIVVTRSPPRSEFH